MNTVSATVAPEATPAPSVAPQTVTEEPEAKNDAVVDIFSAPAPAPAAQKQEVTDMFNFTAD